MTQVGESVAVGVEAPEKKKKLYSCDWSSCEGKHEVELEYPNNGKTTKGGYRAAWIAAKMEPWGIHGKLRKRLRADGGDYKTMTYEYKTQAHHLVPTSLVNETSTLKANLILIGYDCDDEHNGMMLPEFEMDIPLHHLQAHRGNHPGGYMTPIRNELNQLQKDYDGICNSDPLGTLGLQKSVIDETEALARTAKTKVLNIKNGKGFWPLRSAALAEYNNSIAEYARREKLNKKRG